MSGTLGSCSRILRYAAIAWSHIRLDSSASAFSLATCTDAGNLSVNSCAVRLASCEKKRADTYSGSGWSGKSRRKSWSASTAAGVSFKLMAQRAAAIAERYRSCLSATSRVLRRRIGKASEHRPRSASDTACLTGSAAGLFGSCAAAEVPRTKDREMAERKALPGWLLHDPCGT